MKKAGMGKSTDRPPTAPDNCIAGKISPRTATRDIQPPAMTPKQQAASLREMSGAAFLFGTMGSFFGDAIEGEAYKHYRDQLLADSSSPSDPIEIMLLEQLALAHHALGRLHCKAANSQLEAASLYNAAAARLSAEFRKSALALAEYRLASRQRRFGVVGDEPEPIPMVDRGARPSKRSV